MNAWIRKGGAGLTALLIAGGALAQTCPAGSTRVTKGTPADGGSSGGNMSGFITNALICASRGSESWQEWHQAAGQLWDYKLGAASTVDPSEQVGTWTSANGASATVTHTYGASSFIWAICKLDSSTTFPFNYTMVSTTGGTVTGVSIRTVAAVSSCP